MKMVLVHLNGLKSFSVSVFFSSYAFLIDVRCPGRIMFVNLRLKREKVGAFIFIKLF